VLSWAIIGEYWWLCTNLPLFDILLYFNNSRHCSRRLIIHFSSVLPISLSFSPYYLLMISLLYHVLEAIVFNACHYLLFYHDLNYAIVIGPTLVTWCVKIDNVARFRQCRVMFPGNMAIRDPFFRGTWCKPRATMHSRRLFGPTAVLGRSIRILSCCVTDDDTNLLHLFHEKTHIDC